MTKASEDTSVPDSPGAAELVSRPDAILQGTEVSATGSAEELAQKLAALRQRGEREALIQRVGCALVVLGVFAGGVLLLLQYIWILGIEALFVLVIYHYATSLDPELADDPRLQFGEAFLRGLHNQENEVPVKLWMELNAYDMSVADRESPEQDGRVRCEWAQPWFRCELEREFESSEGEARSLEIRLDAVQLQDGIQVLEESQRHSTSLDGQTRVSDAIPDPSELAAWMMNDEAPQADSK